jgi:hypothetical protein
MLSRFSAAAMAMLPSVAATLPHVGEQLPDNLVCLKRTWLKSDHVPPAEGTCGRFLDLRFTSARNAECLLHRQAEFALLMRRIAN